MQTKAKQGHIQRLTAKSVLCHSDEHSPRKTKTKATLAKEECCFPQPWPTRFSFSPIFLTIHTQACQTTPQAQTTMASSVHIDRQKFQTKEGVPLTSLQSHPCSSDSGERYVLWSDIQCAFQGIVRLETEEEVTILFTIDSSGELYVISSQTNVWFTYRHPSNATNR
jgi:hypothetical protein